MNAIATRAAAMAEHIRFGFGEFSLGAALVAATDKGIAAILLGDDRAALSRELAAAFPDGHLDLDQAGLAAAIAKVVAFLENPGESLDLPLDIRGTALERAVWQALRDVPSGKTIAYGQIAKALPFAASAQDVGAACAANVLAVAIPCHRVVKADGSISGYRWGVRRKKTLIHREAQT
jgi:AraC family transcriptional regulator of adaptative response/methylated-DNA-[protein]-cysteine methyltransferase